MYFELIQQFRHTLGNLDAILDKAARHAEARKFDPDAYLALRLAPDMFPFTRQVQIACDAAKTAAALFSGKEPPKHEDNEKTFSELRARIRKVCDYLDSFKAEDFKGTQAHTVVRVQFPQGKAMHAQDAALSRSIPNFFFHVTMAYALLRQAGVEVGKKDYLGELKIFDA